MINFDEALKLKTKTVHKYEKSNSTKVKSHNNSINFVPQIR